MPQPAHLAVPDDSNLDHAKLLRRIRPPRITRKRHMGVSIRAAVPIASLKSGHIGAARYVPKNFAES